MVSENKFSLEKFDSEYKKCQARKESLLEKLQELASTEASLQAASEQNSMRLEDIERLRKDLSTEKNKTDLVERERNTLNEDVASKDASLQAVTTQSFERADAASQLKKDIQQLQEKVEAVEGERNSLREELATVNTSMEKERKHAIEQLALLQENKEALKQEFQNLSQKIFKTSSDICQPKTKNL